LAVSANAPVDATGKGIVMSISSKSIRISIAVLGLFVTQTAFAEATHQTTVADNGDYSYRFADEDLLGDTLGQVGDMYRGRPKFARVLLLRPRTNLVSEILQSAEDL
jgi:hypothetical protein